MNPITLVELGLENCETITIPAEAIDNIQLYDITTARYGSKEQGLVLEEEQIVDGFALILSSLENVASDFYIADNEPAFATHVDYLIERIFSYPLDICSLRVTYQDGSADDYTVDWLSEESEYNHSRQEGFIKDEDGATTYYLKQYTKAEKTLQENENLKNTSTSNWMS